MGEIGTLGHCFSCFAVGGLGKLALSVILGCRVEWWRVMERVNELELNINAIDIE